MQPICTHSHSYTVLAALPWDPSANLSHYTWYCLPTSAELSRYQVPFVGNSNTTSQYVRQSVTFGWVSVWVRVRDRVSPLCLVRRVRQPYSRITCKLSSPTFQRSVHSAREPVEVRVGSRRRGTRSHNLSPMRGYAVFATAIFWNGLAHILPPRDYVRQSRHAAAPWLSCRYWCRCRCGFLARCCARATHVASDGCGSHSWKKLRQQIAAMGQEN